MCNITGKIIVINDEQKVSDSFTKRIFVVETSESHPQFVTLELHQSNVDIIDPYNLGEEVTVFINIRGKAYQKPMEETKYFNSLVCWKILRT